MNKKTVSFKIPEQISILPRIFKWLAIALVVALAAGTASAALLAALEKVTAWREANIWVLALLPVGGFIVGWAYLKLGRSVERGNNLLIDEIHDSRNTIPLRMTPMVFLGTVASHLLGASVGREGTAIQMGGSLADQLAKPLHLDPEDRRILIMCGISAGFGSIFGVPLAGAIFGLEVLAIGKLRYDAIFPCFVASLVGDLVTRAWGIHHAVYSIGMVPDLGILGLGKALVAGAAFGIVGMLFSKTTHSAGAFFKHRISYAPMRPFLGGLIIVLAAAALGSTAYLGLGIPEIAQSFSGHVSPFDFIGKFLFTTLSLGAGFKGGEVTPLFYIGATLGNVMATPLGIPAPLLAGMGFVAVFAGAANTPLASTLMAFELFGPQAGVLAGVACVSSYLFSGHSGIYQAQRIGQEKFGGLGLGEELTLTQLEMGRMIPSTSLMDLHHLGFAKPEGQKEHHLNRAHSSLRIFFRYDAKLKRPGLMSRLAPASLADHLLKGAKEAGLNAAVNHRVSAGYLDHDVLSLDISEVPPPRLPQCVELIGERFQLEEFVRDHKTVLKGARAFIAPCGEAPLFDRGTENLIEEIEQYFLANSAGAEAGVLAGSKEKP